MKLHKTATHHTPALNPIAHTAIKSTAEATESSPLTVRLRAVPANGRTDSDPLYDDIYVQPSTLLRAKQKGFSESFVYLMKKIVLLALDRFKPGDIVDSKMLCAEIRYGLRNDRPVDEADLPGLSKGERLNSGTVVLLLADAGELPLEPLGPNTANLQKYRVIKS